ncbi:M23 family metallopeptidase [Cellulophaga sp. Z1A5H]|uniref:M23 family metallopeptidase n=1 Tax=Cellulophaga sp. Z1A5H TaxID=2687291 RepID=UPI0013FD9705|nr:M23 family metallopeptidase [Cellulophaga sp. Z1A5H]
MNFLRILFVIVLEFQVSCQEVKKEDTIQSSTTEKTTLKVEPQKSRLDTIVEVFKQKSIYKARGFDFPIAKPNAKGYYNAQAFGANNHLGDDWNAVTGGNSDLGDPIYATANGFVNFAADIGGGWGKVIRIWHTTTDGLVVESLYAHCDTMLAERGQYVFKGDKIATIGNADGIYLAHLHFEIRDDVSLPVGAGYATETEGYLDPTKFIKAHRK